MDRDDWNGGIALGVVLAHVLLVHALIAWRPSAGRAGATAETSDAIDVVFVSRRSRMAVPAADGAPPAEAGNRRAGRRTFTATPGDRERAAGVAVLEHAPLGARAPLDLTVPVPQSPTPTGADDWLERPAALDSRKTRFDRAWVRDGTALEQAGQRSRVVGALLGAFGGPPRRCTEVERRLRGINCLPLHGGEEADEHLRRALDRP